jgi:hypothetical protein
VAQRDSQARTGGTERATRTHQPPTRILSAKSPRKGRVAQSLPSLPCYCRHCALSFVVAGIEAHRQRSCWAPPQSAIQYLGPQSQSRRKAIWNEAEAVSTPARRGSRATNSGPWPDQNRARATEHLAQPVDSVASTTASTHHHLLSPQPPN